MTLQEFDALYQQRHEEEALNQCAEQIAKIDTANSSEGRENMEWLWRAAKLGHFQFMQARDENPTLAATHIEAAKQAAKAALKLDGDRIENVFWGATCDLEAASLQGKVAAFAVSGSAQKALDRACVIDETYHFAGPLRVLGRLIQLKPLIMGGNLDRALSFYNRALQLYPNNSTSLLYKADALIADRQPAVARKTLQHLLSEADDINWHWETLRDKELASKWLQTRF